MEKTKLKNKNKKKVLLFTENFEKRILAEDVVGVKNLESFLNNAQTKNRIILEGITSFYKEDGIYKPKDHIRGYQILNTNHIDFIYGAEDLIYSPENLTKYEEVSILWGMKGLHHSLIGDVRIPGNNTPKFKKDYSNEQTHKKEFELISYLNKQLQKNFITLYNLRQDSRDSGKEFRQLSQGLKLPKKIHKILINNKKQSISNTTQAVYLGESSKNYRS